jgi:hypothetical protein
MDDLIAREMAEKVIEHIISSWSPLQHENDEMWFGRKQLIDAITAALTEAVTREREECAKLCDADPADSEMRSYGKYFASAIRARTPPPSGQES